MMLSLSSSFFTYFNDEIIAHLPNNEIITAMKPETEATNHTTLATNIIKTIEKYFQ